MGDLVFPSSHRHCVSVRIKTTDQFKYPSGSISYEREGGIEVHVAVKYTTSWAKISASSCSLFHKCKGPVSLLPITRAGDSSLLLSYALTSTSSGGMGDLGCLLSKCCLKVLGSGIIVWRENTRRNVIHHTENHFIMLMNGLYTTESLRVRYKPKVRIILTTQIDLHGDHGYLKKVP